MDSDLMRWVKAQADDPNANPRFRELLVAIEAAREDAERLDWMDIHRGDDVRQDPHSGGPVLVAHYWAIAGQCTDIRAAIDQARGDGVADAENRRESGGRK